MRAEIKIIPGENHPSKKQIRYALMYSNNYYLRIRAHVLHCRECTVRAEKMRLVCIDLRKE